MPSLTLTIKQKSWLDGMRWAAADALGRMGPEAGKAADALKKATTDERREVTEAAAGALKK